MLEQNYTSDVNPPQPNQAELVDLALSGECPGLLALLISPGLAEHIYRSIEHGSKSSCN